jgi:hypothetical protein
VDIDAGQAVVLLREATGEDYELVGRLDGGESGAHEVRHRADGRRLVLKWDTRRETQGPRRDGADLAEHLRTAAGWPVPRQRVVESRGCLIVLQEFMTGQPVRAMTSQLTDQVLDLHTRRLGLGAGRSGNPWSERLIGTLVQGGSGYCRHESLRGYDARTASLVREIEEIGRRLGPDDCGGTDIVHWDLHPGNLLTSADGALSAVVDNDFCVVGDAAFDLVMLALSSGAVHCAPGVRRHLFDVALVPLAPVRRRAYLAHLFLRLLDWPIRRGNSDEVELWLSAVERCRDAGYF